MSHAEHALPEHCPNCAAAVHGPFCAQCGQETQIEAPTLHEFVHEYLHHYVALDGKLWRTLVMLVTKPGQLTREYLAGRRRRYVRPLPLYVTVSFLFFLVLALTSGSHEATEADTRETNSAISAVREHPLASKETPLAPQTAQSKAPASKVDVGDPDDSSSPFNRKVLEIFNRYQSDPKGASERLEHTFRAKLPYAIFAMMPVFAFASQLLFWRRRRYYGEHLLLAVHLHAFVFLSLLLTYWLPIPSLGTVMAVIWLCYLARAQQTVFGGRFWPQLLRSGALLAIHAVALFCALLVVLALAVLAI